MAIPAIKVEDKMEKAREAKKELRKKRGSPMKAIRNNCIECFGGGRGGRKMGQAIANEIRECTDPECPLFLFRPFKN